MPQAELAGIGKVQDLADIEDHLTAAVMSHQSPGQQSLRRARMSNLVIFCDDAARLQEVQEVIPHIVAVHPARILLAVLEPGAKEEPVTGSVKAWFVKLGEQDHICSEHVTLRSVGGNGDHLVFAVRSLITGDLPTNLWWASITPPPLAGPLMKELAERAQQVIYDSNGWLQPARGVAATAAWFQATERTESREWRVVSDLNWRRLKFWRRILAQALDPNSSPAALDTITEVEIAHGPHAVVQAWLIIGWLASRLGWQVAGGKMQPGVDITWQVRARHGPLTVRIERLPEGPSEIRHIRIGCALNQQPGVLKIMAESPLRLAVIPEGLEMARRTVTVQPQTLDDVIARQLSDRERDPVFRDALVVAQTFAQSVLR